MARGMTEFFMWSSDGWDRLKTELGDELATQQTVNTDAQNKPNKTCIPYSIWLIHVYNLISEKP